MELTIDAIINEWDFGDKDKAFQNLVNYSEKILKELNDKEEKLNYANADEDKKIIFNAVKKTSWYKQQIQNVKDEYKHSNKEYHFNGGM